MALALATLLVLGGLTTAAVALARGGDDHDGMMRGTSAQPGNGHGKGHGNGHGNGFGRQKHEGNGNGLPGMPGQRAVPDPDDDNSLGGTGMGMGKGQLGGVEHGEFTNGTSGTAYLFQRGSVTAASATSLTVKSADGFTATYAVNAQTLVTGRGGPPAVGAQVVVLATKQGNAAVRVKVSQAPNGTPTS